MNGRMEEYSQWRRIASETNQHQRWKQHQNAAVTNGTSHTASRSPNIPASAPETTAVSRPVSPPWNESIETELESIEKEQKKKRKKEWNGMKNGRNRRNGRKEWKNGMKKKSDEIGAVVGCTKREVINQLNVRTKDRESASAWSVRTANTKLPGLSWKQPSASPATDEANSNGTEQHRSDVDISWKQDFKDLKILKDRNSN